MRGAVINASFGENGYDIEVRFAELISPHSVRIGAAWHPGSTDAFSGRLSWGVCKGRHKTRLATFPFHQHPG